jgi:hypothetical protein
MDQVGFASHDAGASYGRFASIAGMGTLAKVIYNAGMYCVGKALRSSIRPQDTPVSYRPLVDKSEVGRALFSRFTKVKESNSNEMPCLDKLSQAGQIMDRGGLTKVGRALDKHGNRPGSVFPKVTGNPASKNIQGQYHLDDILTHPNSKISHRDHRDFGRVMDIEVPGRGGARFSRNGDFIGLLEP